MPLSQGQILHNRYRIVKLLGQGGFGAVYKAWDTTLNVPCAVKESFEVSPEGQRQFVREAQILAGLHHPNLPRVSDFFTVAGQGQYLVMDFVEGQDLEALKAQSGGKLPEDQVLPWISQVCDALNYLHRQKPAVIHRDIKPANIKIAPADEDHPQGRAVLVDFGVAKEYDPTVRTTIGARAVTPGYSPHEQYGQTTASTDARTDIYALGATLYNLLTGQEPPESILRMIFDPLIPPRQLNPGISPGVEIAILKAMHMDPGRRFQSAGEFKKAISGQLPVISSQLPVDSSQLVLGGVSPATQVMPQAPARLILWRWAAIGAVVLLVVVLVVVGASLARDLMSIRRTPAEAARASIPTLATTATYTPPPTLTPTPTITPSPLPPSPTSTPLGGGSGRIAFVSDRDGNREIYVMNVDGSGQTNLTNNGEGDYSPSWSPDGRQIAFSSNRDGDLEIYVMNADGSGLTRLTNNSAIDGSPAWSPDGRQIAFVSYRDGNAEISAEIYVMNADGSGQTRLTNNSDEDNGPAWSPDGRQIAFCSYRDYYPEIYVMNADGSGQTNLTNNNGYDFGPTWSPDGRQIAFYSGRNGNNEIYVMNADGSRQTNLTNDIDYDWHPAWSPDGRHIVFFSDRDGNDEIYVMSVDGSEQTRLTNNSTMDWQPSWAP